MGIRTSRKTRIWYFRVYLIFVGVMFVATGIGFFGGAFDPASKTMQPVLMALTFFSSFVTFVGVLLAYSVIMFEFEKEED